MYSPNSPRRPAKSAPATGRSADFAVKFPERPAPTLGSPVPLKVGPAPIPAPSAWLGVGMAPTWGYPPAPRSITIHPMLTSRGWWFLLFVLTLLAMGGVLAVRPDGGPVTLLLLGLTLFAWFAWEGACFAVQARLGV